VRVTNDEMLSPRDFGRSPAGHLDRLEDGDVEKLVLTRASEMKFVVITVDRFEELELAEQALKAQGQTP
jgi:1-deoxy-D-xylulose 5-phosphate reductoisomerase